MYIVDSETFYATVNLTKDRISLLIQVVAVNDNTLYTWSGILESLEVFDFADDLALVVNVEKILYSYWLIDPFEVATLQDVSY